VLSTLRGDGGEASGLKGSYGFVHSWRGSVLQICHQVAGVCDVVRGGGLQSDRTKWKGFKSLSNIRMS
jgi:hypothetical protein